MRATPSVRFARAAIVLAALATGRAHGATPAGTVIANVAQATFTDGNGNRTSVASNPVHATVAAVSGVVVGTKETGCDPAADTFAAGSPVTKIFSITNGSNVVDAYAIVATTSAGTLANVAAVVGPTTTPLINATSPLAPGATAFVAVTVATASIATGTRVTIALKATSTANGTANGRASDAAMRCAIAAGGAALSGPAGAGTPLTKLVNDRPLATGRPGSLVRYSIAFVDSGGVPARDVTIVDDVPAGVDVLPRTVAVDGVASTKATLTGRHLVVPIGTIAPGGTHVVTFDATIAAGALGSSAVNVASATASNAAGTVSTAASVLVGQADVVYDGNVGASLPVAGAVVSLLDAATNRPVVLDPHGLAPNAANADPFTTGSDGTYAFALPARAISGSYVLQIVAPGYLNRRIALTLVADATGTLYTVTLRSLDGQPLAEAGGFSLATTDVSLAHVFGLFGNLPLFHAQNVQISKTVDRSFAAAGDRLVYAIAFSNAGTALGPTTVVDTLPVGVAYAPGTGVLDGRRVEPRRDGRTLTWTLPALDGPHALGYAAVVLPGVAEASTLTNTVAIAAGVTDRSGVTFRASATADTKVIAGAFTDRTIVTGRVFRDRARSCRFGRGDAGVANVRLFLEDGESVVTDAEGRFSFPGVRPGMHVLRLDALTLPADARAFPSRAYDDACSIRRLVHGIFDGGTIEDVDFAVESVR